MIKIEMKFNDNKSLWYFYKHMDNINRKWDYQPVIKSVVNQINEQIPSIEKCGPDNDYKI